MSEPDTVIALPTVVEPVTHVRSTLIQLSLSQLKASGHFEAYERLLPPADRSAIIDTFAPTWLPIVLAEAHYGACDGLALSPTELLKVGEAVGAKINSTLMSTLTRVARLAGITPWQFYSQVGRVWSRTFQGGAVGLTRVGPTESRIELRGLSLCRITYFRFAASGVFNAIAKLAARHSTTTIVEHGPAHLCMRGVWNESA
jgi:hypothetical protein